MSTVETTKDGLRRAVLIVALLNLGYFGIEFAVALAIGSVSLFADSIDFLEDAAINLLILLGLAWPAHRRRRLGKVLAAIILVPAIATLWMAAQKLLVPVAPAPVPLTLTGFGAVLVNFAAAARSFDCVPDLEKLIEETFPLTSVSNVAPIRFKAKTDWGSSCVLG